jgi:uncharacterized protein DUF2867
MSVTGLLRARRVEVSEELHTLPEPDYASTFAVSVPGANDRSPEEWVRATFEGAPKAIRWFVVVGWRYVLGLRLGPRPSATHVLGWRIISSTSEAIMLEARSALVTAQKVLRVEDSQVRVTTFVQYHRGAARAIWSAIAPVHHRTEPFLLGHAASHFSPSRVGGA